jgi:hypothetical protein
MSKKCWCGKWAFDAGLCKVHLGALPDKSASASHTPAPLVHVGGAAKSSPPALSLPSPASPPTIDTLLESVTLTLEDLLEEDHVIQESKGGNVKLLSYLTRDVVMAKLIQYARAAGCDLCDCSFQVRRDVSERPCDRGQSAAAIPTRCFRAAIHGIRMHTR